VCGRYVSVTDPATLMRHFEVDEDRLDDGPGAVRANWNVAPTTTVPIIVDEVVEEVLDAAPDGVPGGAAPVRILRSARWGLVPSWARDPSIGTRMINARSETLAGKPSFRAAFRRHRCIVPADGFYEWRRTGAGRGARKQPYFIAARDGAPLALAGLYEHWRDPAAGDGDAVLVTCTIITTDANAVLAPLHDRMPAVLPHDAWDIWLDPAVDDTDVVAAVLAPAADDVLAFRPVGTAVGSVRNNGPELIDEVDVDESERRAAAGEPAEPADAADAVDGADEADGTGER
jgi:putative SOS response-associated peptidase YedK